VAFDALEDIQAMALHDDYEELESGSFRVRAIHAATGVGEVDIWNITDMGSPATLYEDVPFAAVGDYYDLGAGAWPVTHRVGRERARLRRVYPVEERLGPVELEDRLAPGDRAEVREHKETLIARAEQLAQMVAEGQSVAIVTDAGSPGISDPAYRIVRAAVDSGLEIVALPGPCAIIPALTASGLPTDRFFFEGFLSNKSAARRRRLEQLQELEHTLVFYESPHRVKKTLADMLEVLGNRPACLAREISKKFEEYIRGNISDIIQRIGDRNIKGEIVLLVGGKSDKGDTDD